MTSSRQPTTVVNVRQFIVAPRKIILPPDVIYIGRWNAHYNLPSSPFHNPFPLKDFDDDRELCLAAFREWFTKQRDLIDRVRAELTGKRLACWCAPAGCHGDLYVEICDG